MKAQIGDYVTLRDGRFLVVTDANTEDNIFIGYHVHPELFEDPNLGEPGYEPVTVVSDMSEITSVCDNFGDSIER